MMPDLRVVAIADQVECVPGTRMRDVDLGQRQFWTSRSYKWDDDDLVDSDIGSRYGRGWQSGTGDLVVVVVLEVVRRLMASLEDEFDERTVRMCFSLVMGFCKGKLDVEGLSLRVLEPSFGRGENGRKGPSLRKHR
jgi:hypothetical protein